MWSAGTRDDTWKHAELSRTQGNEKYRPTRAVRTSAGSMKRDRILTRYYVQNIALEWNVTRDQDEKEHFPSKYFLHFSIWIVQNRDKFWFRAYSTVGKRPAVETTANKRPCSGPAHANHSFNSLGFGELVPDQGKDERWIIQRPTVTHLCEG